MKKFEFNTKKLKYGTASVVLTVVFIAFVFIINLVAGVLTEKYNWYADLTEEQLYTISDESFRLLEDMDEPVKIIFLTPLDQLDSDSYVKNIKTLALEYEEKFDNISIEYIDMKRNPELVRKYKRDYSLRDTTIIVESEKRFAAFDMAECFVYTQNNDGSYSYYAFNGEYRFTSSLMKVTREVMPIVGFVTNHGEEIPTAFKQLFTDSGFDVQLVDLMQGTIPEETEILIMVNPQSDITGAESEETGKSEVTKLNSYLGQGKDLMIFVDPNTPELKTLDEFLYTWGIDVIHGVAVQDDKNYLNSANNMALIASYYNGDEDSVALHSKVSGKENPMTAVSYYTSPISLVPINNVSRNVSPILLSESSAYVPKNASENIIDSTRIPLLVAAYQRTYNSETGNTDKNYVIVGGSTYFVSDQYLGALSATFANSDLIRNIAAEMTDETIVLDVPYKIYQDTSLKASAQDSRQWASALIIVLPSIVLVAALGVFLKRRHL